MNITPVSYRNNNHIKNNNQTFSGQIVPNKYLENCIEYTIKTNDHIKIKKLFNNLLAILNDGTERLYEFDGALKSSGKGVRYEPTVKIDNKKPQIRLQAMFKLQDLNNKNLADECQNSIDTVIKKFEILFNAKSSGELEAMPPVEVQKSSELSDAQPKDLKKGLEMIYKEIFKKAEQ